MIKGKKNLESSMVQCYTNEWINWFTSYLGKSDINETTKQEKTYDIN